MTSFQTYISIAVGGALGATSRFAVYQMMIHWFGKGFPFGTLIVNVLGSFLLGLVYGLIEQGQIAAIPWRGLLAVGFLGAFTTFSTFSLDSLLLLQQGDYTKGVINIFMNLGCCLMAAWLGLHLIKG